MVSEAKKSAIARWDREHMTSVGCRLTKEKAAEFKAACTKLGVKPTAVIRQAVDQTIEESKKDRSE